MTVVYKDGKPVYTVITTWEDGTPKMNWLPHHTVNSAQVIAKMLAKEYDNKKRFNMHRTDIPRYKREYIESACIFLKKLGYSAEVVYNDINDNHCHTITLRRK